jgi:hypothetical protein
MVNFTFNMLDRIGLLNRLYTRISYLLNKHLLSRSNFDGEVLSSIFDAVDGFWVKHRESDWYSQSELRVIIGSIAESVRDNHLSPDEVRVIVDYVSSEWRPEIAKRKEGEGLISSEVENTAVKAVDIYRKISKTEDVDPFSFASVINLLK